MGEQETRVAFESRFPNGEVTAIESVPGWDESLEALGSVDWLFGYSLGAYLTLMEKERLSSLARRVTLLAPFEDFKAEAGRGGRTRKGQLGYLLKWLDRNPEEAIADFRKRAVLREKSPDLERNVEDLKWGIRILKDTACEFGSLSGVECYVGERDPLLDAERLKELYPSMGVIVDAGHELEALLEGLED
jgi:pimeloyl-ACP methyl ester carboxylesterase